MGVVVDYLVKETAKPWHVRIYTNGEEIAEVRKRKDVAYILAAKDGNKWALTTRVHGEVRPFSMTVTQSEDRDAHATSETTVMTIRDHLFMHNGKFYLLGCSPEGRPLREFLVGRRYICRLDNFPFSDLDKVDHETRSRLKRFRGPPVGELDGLGKEGHHVRLSDELEEIGLPLATCCYLLYSTA